MHTRSAEFDQSREKIASHARGLVEGAEELLRTTAAYSGDEFDSARGKLNDQLAQVRNLYKGLESSAVGSYRQASSQTDAYVHENPWRAIGIAAAVGALVGLLALRR